jgi:hypothetical protein
MDIKFNTNDRGWISATITYKKKKIEIDQLEIQAILLEAFRVATVSYTERGGTLVFENKGFNMVYFITQGMFEDLDKVKHERVCGEVLHLRDIVKKVSEILEQIKPPRSKK